MTPEQTERERVRLLELAKAQYAEMQVSGTAPIMPPQAPEQSQMSHEVFWLRQIHGRLFFTNLFLLAIAVPVVLAFLLAVVEMLSRVE